MIRVRGLRKSYRSGKVVDEVLRGVDLDVADGEFLSIVGRSGCGKTTLLHILGGLDADYDGEVAIDGKPLGDLRDNELSDYRNRQVGFVFQSFNLLGHMTSLENVMLPAIFARGQTAMDDGATRKRAKAVLEELDLGDKLLSRPGTLSGGQRQRVAIARALFNRPRIMLCDEPTGNLDSGIGGQIIQLFRNLNREQGITVVIVTHDALVSKVTDRTIVVQDGVLVEQSRPAAEQEMDRIMGGPDEEESAAS